MAFFYIRKYCGITAIIVSIIAIFLMISFHFLTSNILNDVRLITGISKEKTSELSEKMENIKQYDNERTLQMEIIKNNLDEINKTISKEDIPKGIDTKIETISDSFKKIENYDLLKIINTLPEVPKEIMKYLLENENVFQKKIYDDLRFVPDSVDIGLKFLNDKGLIQENNEKDGLLIKIKPQVLKIIKDLKIIFD